ncbi:MAG TPA: pseudouridine synthase [Pyrinomonadaceae bacterium]|nr:pseudouridine synthase [Pyrinomonadaceae bacterium]
MEERLQKLIAAAGLASRRHAEELIAAGEVTVNGEVVREQGTKADPARDHIKVRGRLINPLLEAREKVYVLLNKPRGYLSSLNDPEKRKLVSDLVPQSLGRLHPVGRLDYNSEGLLILTNDGELTNHVTSARNHIPKVYEVKVKGVPPEAQVERLRRGVRLDDGVRTAPAEITKAGETKTNAWFEVILREGRNQQIRRMFDSISHSVIKLRRVRIGPIADELLPVGAWRRLTPREVAQLRGKGRARAGAKSPAASKGTKQKGGAAGREGQGGRAPAKGAPRTGRRR